MTVSSKVYAPAVANLSGTVVNFGAVRQNTGNASKSLTLTNGATGALTDSLVTTGLTGQPAGVTAPTLPGTLAQGQWEQSDSPQHHRRRRGQRLRIAWI